jgi:hypothetical protein
MDQFLMNRQMITDALSEVGQIVFEAGKLIDIGIYGGAALILASNFRESSSDIDAVVVPTDDIAWVDNRALFKKAAKEVSLRKDWPENWLNSSVSAFISPKVDYHEGLEYLRTFPDETKQGLKAFVPNASYLLAMKLKACRLLEFDETKTDLPDIVNLMQVVKPESPEELVKIGTVYFPELRTDGKLHMHLKHIWMNYEDALHQARVPTPSYPIRGYPRVSAG